GLFERARAVDALLLDRRADEIHYDPLTDAFRLRQDRFGDGGGGRLGDEHDDLGVAVLCELLQALQHGDAADLLRKVVAAGADRMRDAAARAMHEAGDLLRAGARIADDADRAAAHRVVEAERNAVDDR